MAKTYAISEIVGTSSEGVTEAIESAVATRRGRCATSTGSRSWRCEVRSSRTGVTEYQVTMKVGFRYED